MPIRRLDKTLTATTATVAGEDIAANSIPVKPHIQYGVLQPAVAGKLLNGATHSGAYGTAQTQSGGDGHSYYYTDIKGSKPIKDPRIGAHFGSQRHKIRSIQLLEQETATHGSDVYSIDGREWMRCTGGNWQMLNNGHGHRLMVGNVSTYPNAYIEVVGYFNGINTSAYTDSNHKFRYSLDGGSEVATDYGANSSGMVLSVTGTRFIDAGSSTNIPISTTLGIHTIKLRSNGAEHDVYGIELIAQDTTSTATKSKIQIPAQNVVSYGKKFSVSATAHHYDPFNGFTNGTTLHSAVVDTATSLGLDTAPGSSAKWAISGSNNIRPYNGGRVVKWIDSDGTIKTSVNMMPPNAQKGVGSGAHSEITTPSATNTAYLPAFSDDAIDHSQAEVAKTFHWREFGNGSANAGTGAPYADASMIKNTNDNITYVMDDGLSSLSAQTWQAHISGTHDNVLLAGATTPCYITFIGTGISMNFSTDSTGADHRPTIAQNLPYGTHILKILYHTGGSNDLFVDGVQVEAAGADTIVRIKDDVTFHQPKKPPIPEDACIIADYMLMADFVAQTAAGAGTISKGVRSQSSTRDCFFEETDGDAFAITIEAGEHSFGMGVQLNGNADSDTSATIRIPSFGTNYVHRGYQSDTRVKLYLDTTDKDSAATKDNSASYGSYAHLTSSLELGVYKFGANAVSGQRGDTDGFDIVTPIHTSSHYQAFETPFLNELVGGDRNMEQNNLIVTPDGKSWDEVTRDTSYIGNIKVIVSTEETDPNHDWMFKYWNDWRGTFNSVINCGNKDFAISYDRIICLVGGHYNFYLQLWINDGISSSDWTQIRINGQRLVQTYLHDTTELKLVQCQATGHLQRGDYVQIFGASRKDDHEVNRFEITKLEK